MRDKRKRECRRGYNEIGLQGKLRWSKAIIVVFIAGHCNEEGSYEKKLWSFHIKMAPRSFAINSYAELAEPK